MKSNSKKILSISGILIFVLILLSLYISGCSDQSTNPDLDLNTFSFSVKVIDDNNNPMNGIAVGSFYYPSYPLSKQTRVNNLLNPMASTNVRFSIMQQCITNLIVYDLENVIVKKIVENQSMQAGVYSIAFNAADLKGSVYKVKLVARDTLNQNTLYTDSIYTTLLHLDPQPCKMGITSGSGNFITNDKIYFPSLYTLPDLIRTSEFDPTPLGTFTITNQITIQLTDTLTNDTKTFNKTISEGKNEFVLKFSEGTEAIYKIADFESIPRKDEVQGIFRKINGYWSLEQNYPNPFN